MTSMFTKLFRPISRLPNCVLTLEHCAAVTYCRTNVSLYSTLQQKEKSISLNKCFLKTYSALSTPEKEVDHDEQDQQQQKVTIIGENVPQPFNDIDSSDFPDEIKDYLKSNGFVKPTVIQAQSWPIALNGQNFVGIAQTGTGKTLAFLLPAIVHLKRNKAAVGRGARVLVLTPTRELARQIDEVAQDVQKFTGLRCACIYGGVSRNVQAEKLARGVDIIIATPGRLNDFLESKVTNLGRCTYVVLDEADRMLDMGFEPQIRQALEGVPLERQILMFSATWPKEVRQLATEYLGSFIQVNVGSTKLSANPNIQQNIHVCSQNEKMQHFRAIMQDLMSKETGKILVFSNFKNVVEILTTTLRRNGWRTEGIHGGKTQMMRDNALNSFKEGRNKILVATDVAGRGLDVDGISHVINFDFPDTTEAYVHRIGRTARSTNKGVAHTFVTESNANIAYSLIEILKEAGQEVPVELEELAQSDPHQQKNSYGYRSQNRRQYNNNYSRPSSNYSRSNNNYSRSNNNYSRSNNNYSRSNDNNYNNRNSPYSGYND